MLWLFVRPTGVYLLDFFCSGIQFYLLLSPYLCFISLLYLDLYDLYLIVSIPDLCILTYFNKFFHTSTQMGILCIKYVLVEFEKHILKTHSPLNFLDI